MEEVFSHKPITFTELGGTRSDLSIPHLAQTLENFAPEKLAFKEKDTGLFWSTLFHFLGNKNLLSGKLSPETFPQVSDEPPGTSDSSTSSSDSFQTFTSFSEAERVSNKSSNDTGPRHSSYETSQSTKRAYHHALHMDSSQSPKMDSKALSDKDSSHENSQPDSNTNQDPNDSSDPTFDGTNKVIPDYEENSTDTSYQAAQKGTDNCWRSSQRAANDAPFNTSPDSIKESIDSSYKSPDKDLKDSYPQKD